MNSCNVSIWEGGIFSVFNLSPPEFSHDTTTLGIYFNFTKMKGMRLSKRNMPFMIARRVHIWCTNGIPSISITSFTNSKNSHLHQQEIEYQLTFLRTMHNAFAHVVHWESSIQSKELSNGKQNIQSCFWNRYPSEILATLFFTMKRSICIFLYIVFPFQLGNICANQAYNNVEISSTTNSSCRNSHYNGNATTIHWKPPSLYME